MITTLSSILFAALIAQDAQDSTSSQTSEKSSELRKACEQISSAKSYTFEGDVKAQARAFCEADATGRLAPVRIAWAKETEEETDEDTSGKTREIEFTGKFVTGKPAFLESDDCDVYRHENQAALRHGDEGEWTTKSAYAFMPGCTKQELDAANESDEIDNPQRAALLMAIPLPHEVAAFCSRNAASAKVYNEDPGILTFERVVHEVSISAEELKKMTTGSSASNTLRGGSRERSGESRTAGTRGAEASVASQDQSATRTACARLLCHDDEIQEIEVYVFLGEVPAMEDESGSDKRGEQLGEKCVCCYKIEISEINDTELELPDDLPELKVKATSGN